MEFSPDPASAWNFQSSVTTRDWLHALAQLLQAVDALKAVREQVLPPLQRAVALAEDQYRKGDVAYLFVLEQNRGLIDAQLRVVDSEAAIRRAQAQLERSVGSRYDFK